MRFVPWVVVACLLSSVGPASAEWFADVYGGYSLTQNNDVTSHTASAGLSHYRDVEFDRSLAYGGRVGRYFDAVPFLGLGIDFFKFSPAIGPQQLRIDGCVPSGGCSGGPGGTTGRIDVDSWALSLDVLLRLPLLKTENAPWGAIQPYVTAGAPLFNTTVTPRTTSQFRNQDGDTDRSFGYKFGGGVAFHVARNLMFFAEYRFTHAETNVELHDAALLKAAPLRFDLDTHTGLVGLSARW
jgi:opacity protein-like surface antigen